MQKSKLGKTGEDIACEYLVQNKFQIVERNARKPWGEIDIVVKAPDKTLVFVEVKTMRESPGRIQPEDQMTKSKMKKIKRAASLYAGSHQKLVNNKRGWRLDMIAVTQNMDKSHIKHYKNIS